MYSYEKMGMLSEDDLGKFTCKQQKDKIVTAGE